MRQIKINAQITSRESLSLEKYLNDISKIALLTPEEEVALSKKIKIGDQDALEQLTRANLRFVVSVAKQYQHQGLPLIDLINEGNLGLMKAAKRFDASRGFKFISYAVWWIRQTIMQALAEHSRMIRLPLNKVDAYLKLNKILSEFLQKNQREPSIKELADLAEISDKEVRKLLKIGSKHVSIDAPLDEDDDGGSLLSTISSEDDRADGKLQSESLKKEIIEALSVLSRREAEIIIGFYGLGGNIPLSLEDIADQFDLTRERVRQIKEKAIRRLRKTTKGSQLKAYLG